MRMIYPEDLFALRMKFRPVALSSQSSWYKEQLVPVYKLYFNSLRLFIRMVEALIMEK